MKSTACPLDCYDACKILVDDEGGLHGDKSHPFGNGALCSVVNRYMPQASRIQTARIDGKEVSIEEALEETARVLKQSEKTLLWRGSGHMGVMQEVSNLLMARIGGYLTEGSLCDGAGAAGIEEGRGVNKTLPPEQIAKAETVVVWGRNLTVTDAHMMPLIEGKRLIVIDPVRTKIAEMADLHLQLQPRSDYYLAIILARFVFMADKEDRAWMDRFASEYEDFYDYTREHRIKAILEYIGTDLGEMGRLLDLIYDKKTVFLVGTGVQKYSIGSYVLQAIDALAACLGLFGKEGCGVHYLGNSKEGFDNPFEVNCKRVSKVLTPFETFDCVIIQGGNPAESMPDAARVRRSLEAVENLIYFGLYENESAKRARIVIPAKTFLEKPDIRLSYGHPYVTAMHQVVSSDIGISEYTFTRKLCELLSLEPIESEAHYLEHWLSQCERLGENLYRSPGYEPLPYKEGFGCDCDEEFTFICEYDDSFVNTKRFHKIRKKKLEQLEGYWLLTPKSPHSINTQFERDDRVYLHPSLGFSEGERVKVVSEHGEAVFAVKLSDALREDCVMIRNNAYDVNLLTPPILSEEGHNACYQEVKVTIDRL